MNEKTTFWNSAGLPSNSTVAKKCESRLDDGTFDHALATVIQEGLNSLRAE